METMVGIAVLLVGVGVLWVCFALGVYLFTRTGREGIRIKRMEEELRSRPRDLDPKRPGKARPTPEEGADGGGDGRVVAAEPHPPAGEVASLQLGARRVGGQWRWAARGLSQGSARHK